MIVAKPATFSRRLFTAGTLGASAIWIGLVEGIGEGTALIAKVFSGVVADRFGHKKRLVFAGYFLGVVSKPVFALDGCMPVVLAARFFDRIGKGLRGAPRDAIVADVTDESIRDAAYGLRQSLDAAGAFVGPLIATLLLLLWTEDLRSIFWIALIPGAACLLLILIGVEDNVTETKSTKRIEWNEIGSVMTPAFRQLVILGTLFSLARFSNAFIVLKAADIGIDQAWIPMIIVLMNIAFSLSSYPFGMLADRLNPMRLLAFGMVLLALSDLLFAFVVCLCCKHCCFDPRCRSVRNASRRHSRNLLLYRFRSGSFSFARDCLWRIQLFLGYHFAGFRPCCGRLVGAVRCAVLLCRRGSLCRLDARSDSKVSFPGRAAVTNAGAMDRSTVSQIQRKYQCSSQVLVHNDSKPRSVILEGELYDQQTIAHYRFRRRCGVSDRSGSYGRR